MNSSTPKAFETTVVHAGEDPERHLGSLSTPIYQTALHVFPNAEDGHLIHEGHKPGYFYGRMGNPTPSRASPIRSAPWSTKITGPSTIGTWINSKSICIRS